MGVIKGETRSLDYGSSEGIGLGYRLLPQS